VDSPECVAGMAIIKGCPAAVIDVAWLLSGAQAPVFYSTRIALLKERVPLRAGLLLPRATKMVRADELLDAGPAAGRFCPRVFSTEGRTFCVIDPRRLLEAAVPRAGEGGALQ